MASDSQVIQSQIRLGPVTDPRPGHQSTRYRADIDGLRAIAVTAVVLFHAGLPGLSSGFVGVDVFFVISGFLIGGILDREIGLGTFSYVSFYARRAKRILPALAVVTLVSLLAGCFLLGPNGMRVFAASASAALLGFANVLFWLTADYFAPDSRLKPFLMTWSLGVEEQFYVLFPIILIAIRRLSPIKRFQVIAAIVMLSFALSIWMTAQFPTAAFYTLPPRAWELGAGAMLAMVARARAASGGTTEPSATIVNLVSVAGVAMLIVANVCFNEQTPFPGTVALLPVAGTVALIWSERSAFNRHVLSSAPMVWTGRISYSWYLWHWPLMSMARLAALTEPSPMAMVAVALLSLGLAWVSWRYVEVPFRTVRLADRVVLLRYGAATIAVAGLCAGIFALRGVPGIYSKDLLFAERASLLHRSCLSVEGEAVPHTDTACAPAGAGLAILGDSHADAVAPAIRTLAEKKGIAVAQFTKASCPVLLGASRSQPTYPRHAAECAAYSARVMDRLLKDPAVTTVVLTGFWSAPFLSPGASEHYTWVGSRPGPSSDIAILKEGIRETARRLTAAGKHVVVLGDVPSFDFDALKAVETGMMPIRARLGALLDPETDAANGVASLAHVKPEYLLPVAAVREAVEGVPGASYIDLSAAFCDSHTCRYADGRIPYFRDRHHLTNIGADVALAALAKHL